MNMRLAALGLALCLIASPVLAQVAATPVPPSSRPADYNARLAIAQKIDAVQPASQQVDEAIARLAQRVPAQGRADFQARLEASIDKKHLQAVSIDAMAQTYSVPELQRMYDYYSAPEAQAIARKYAIYRQLVQPEIIREMDKAVMSAKLGNQTSPAAAPATQPAQKPAMSGWQSAVQPPAGR